MPLSHTDFARTLGLRPSRTVPRVALAPYSFSTLSALSLQYPEYCEYPASLHTAPCHVVPARLSEFRTRPNASMPMD